MEKPALEDAPSNLAVFGRYLLSARVMELLAEAKPTVGGEIQLTDALDAVRREPGRTAYEIAGSMAWSIRCRSWAEFPLTQKYFAVGEALAHLDYLMVRGQVQRREEHGKWRYYAV